MIENEVYVYCVICMRCNVSEWTTLKDFAQRRERRREALARAKELMGSGGEAALEAAKATDAEFAKWLVRVVGCLLFDALLSVVRTY
jgi:hypothetical protein